MPETSQSQLSPSSELGEEYDVDVLNAIIESATTTEKQVDPLFSFGEIHLLEILNEVLKSRLPQEEIVLILDELRASLYAGSRSSSISDLHAIIANQTRKSQLPHWNIKSPDVVFINEYAPFWNESDQAFVKLLSEVGFRSTFCAWTSLYRAEATGDTALNPEEEVRWSNFLFSEIRIWKPKLIIPLGKKMSSFFLGEEVNMSEQQGIINWVGPWAILPLYSYAYSIKSNKTHLFTQGLTNAHEFCLGDT